MPQVGGKPVYCVPRILSMSRNMLKCHALGSGLLMHFSWDFIEIFSDNFVIKQFKQLIFRLLSCSFLFLFFYLTWRHRRSHQWMVGWRRGKKMRRFSVCVRIWTSLHPVVVGNAEQFCHKLLVTWTGRSEWNWKVLNLTSLSWWSDRKKKDRHHCELLQCRVLYWHRS